MTAKDKIIVYPPDQIGQKEERNKLLVEDKGKLKEEITRLYKEATGVESETAVTKFMGMENIVPFLDSNKQIIDKCRELDRE